MSAILDLPLSTGIDLIFHALEYEKTQTAWDLWTIMYPYMQKKEIESVEFTDFKRKLFEKKHHYSKKSIEEIEAEMMNLVSAYEGR